MDKYSFRIKNVFAGGVQLAQEPPDVNLGPPIISETITARMLKLKIQLDVVKYLLMVDFSARWRLGVHDPLM